MSDVHGHIKISRKAFLPRHQGGDRWWNEKRAFSNWEAWQYMIQAASWTDRDFVLKGGELLPLVRGETPPLSVRFLMDAWGWGSKKRVLAFLKRVQEWDRVRVQQRVQHGTTYLIVNYEHYQGGDLEAGTATGTPPGTPPGTVQKRPEASKAKEPPSTPLPPSPPTRGVGLNGQTQKTGRPTWLTPFADAWIRHVGGDPIWGAMAKALRKLIDRDGDDAVLRTWLFYLEHTEPQFCSPQSFASKYGSWKRQAQPNFAGFD